MTRFLRRLSVGAALMILTGTQAAAQTPAAALDAPICENQSGRSTPHDRVTACTRLLDETSLSPEQEAMTRINRAWAYTLLHQMGDAHSEYDKAVALDPGSQVVLNERALFFLRLGDLNSALRDYDLALRLDPAAAYSLYGRGLTYLRKGDVQHGEIDMAAARRLDSGVDAVFRNIGVGR